MDFLAFMILTMHASTAISLSWSMDSIDDDDNNKNLF